MIYATYYGTLIDYLSAFANMPGDGPKKARRDIYDIIRDESGLAFEDYGDEPERWLAWMRANDTTDKAKARRIRDENRRRREAAKS